MRKIVFLLLILVSSYGGSACDCTELLGLDRAVVVFNGVVTSVAKSKVSYQRYEVTFRVYNWQKGVRVEKFITIYTPCLIDPCCGIPFTVGEEYSVFTYLDGDILYTNLCTATHKISK